MSVTRYYGIIPLSWSDGGASWASGNPSGNGSGTFWPLTATFPAATPTGTKTSLFRLFQWTPALPPASIFTTSQGAFGSSYPGGVSGGYIPPTAIITSWQTWAFAVNTGVALATSSWNPDDIVGSNGAVQTTAFPISNSTPPYIPETWFAVSEWVISPNPNGLTFPNTVGLYNSTNPPRVRLTGSCGGTAAGCGIQIDALYVVLGVSLTIDPPHNPPRGRRWLRH